MCQKIFHTEDCKNPSNIISYPPTCEGIPPETFEEINFELCPKLGCRCFYTLALSLLRPDLCYFLEDYQSKEQCFENIALGGNKPDVCRALEPDLTIRYYPREECFKKVALAYKNPNLCELTPDPKECILEIAADKNDPNVCEKMLDKKEKEMLSKVRDKKIKTIFAQQMHS